MPFTPAELKNKRIGVLVGGLSAEREVSLATGAAVVKALIGKGYAPRSIDVGRDIAGVLSRERPIRGAITAFSTCVSPQFGQAIPPAFCWSRKPSPSRNHASNSWPEAQRKLNRIIATISAPAYLPRTAHI